MPALHLPIASPCHEDWDAMDARERGRFCRSCAKDVHDLASMTESEARALLADHAGQRICVRYNADRAGRIHFRPEAARVALATLALAACTPHDNPGHAAPKLPPMEQAVQHVVAPVPQPELVPTMGEAPIVEPERVLMGDIAAPAPAKVQHVKGEIAVPNEPCDPAAKPAGGLDDLPRFHDGMR